MARLADLLPGMSAATALPIATPPCTVVPPSLGGPVIVVDASDEVPSGAGFMAGLVDTSNSEDDALMDSWTAGADTDEVVAPVGTVEAHVFVGVRLSAS